MRALLALVTALLLLGGVVPVRPLPCACTAERNCGCRCFAREGAAEPTGRASCCAGPRAAACSATHGGSAPAEARHGHGTVRIDVALRAAEPVFARSAHVRTWAAAHVEGPSWRCEPLERPPDLVS